MVGRQDQPINSVDGGNACWHAGPDVWEGLGDALSNCCRNYLSGCRRWLHRVPVDMLGWVCAFLMAVSPNGIGHSPVALLPEWGCEAVLCRIADDGREQFAVGQDCKCGCGNGLPQLCCCCD